MTHILRL